VSAYCVARLGGFENRCEAKCQAQSARLCSTAPTLLETKTTNLHRTPPLIMNLVLCAGLYSPLISSLSMKCGWPTVLIFKDNLSARDYLEIKLGDRLKATDGLSCSYFERWQTYFEAILDEREVSLKLNLM